MTLQDRLEAFIGQLGEAHVCHVAAPTAAGLITPGSPPPGL